MTETPLQALGRIARPADVENVDPEVNPHWWAIFQAYGLESVADLADVADPDAFVLDLKAIAAVPLTEARALNAIPGMWDDLPPGEAADRIAAELTPIYESEGEG